jgi:hypothetical protein
MKEISNETPMSPYLLVMAGLSLLVMFVSPITLWRRLAIVSAIAVLGAFAPFILAQDTSAYRRALGTNLAILIPIVIAFAIRSRRGFATATSLTLCGAFCVLKAPLEIAPLFTNMLHAPLCIACHEHFNVRNLVNTPIYQGIKERPLIFILDGENVAGHYGKCGAQALNSHEMKTLSPLARYVRLENRSVQEMYDTISVGEILVIVCPTASAPQGAMQQICEAVPPFGKFLGSVKDHTNPFNPRTKWVFVEKINP